MHSFRKIGFVYIITNPGQSVLYTGVSSDLLGRTWQHREHIYQKSFTNRYNCIRLVYFCYYDTIGEAISAEKRIKGGSRAKKIKLIESINPKWEDLWETIQDH